MEICLVNCNESKRFVPQVILLCPKDVYTECEELLKRKKNELCVVCYELPVEDPFTLTRTQGQTKDEKLLTTLTGKEQIRKSRLLLSRIKFLRADPPVPYTAWLV